MGVEVYGVSDDLISVEGDIHEEFDAYDDGEEGSLLAFSDGTVVRIVLSASGVWRITLVVTPAPDTCVITQAPEDDEDDYSDRAALSGEIRWVVRGDKFARA
jgi:hypothetical protein